MATKRGFAAAGALAWLILAVAAPRAVHAYDADGTEVVLVGFPAVCWNCTENGGPSPQSLAKASAWWGDRAKAVAIIKAIGFNQINVAVGGGKVAAGYLPWNETEQMGKPVVQVLRYTQPAFSAPSVKDVALKYEDENLWWVYKSAPFQPTMAPQYRVILGDNASVVFGGTCGGPISNCSYSVVVTCAEAGVRYLSSNKTVTPGEQTVTFGVGPGLDLNISTSSPVTCIINGLAVQRGDGPGMGVAVTPWSNASTLIIVPPTTAIITDGASGFNVTAGSELVLNGSASICGTNTCLSSWTIDCGGTNQKTKIGNTVRFNTGASADISTAGISAPMSCQISLTVTDENDKESTVNSTLLVFPAAPVCSSAQLSPPTVDTRSTGEVCAALRAARAGKRIQRANNITLALIDPQGITATINITNIISNKDATKPRCPRGACVPDAKMLGPNRFQLMPQMRYMRSPSIGIVGMSFRVSFVATGAGGSCSGTVVLCAIKDGSKPNPPACTPFGAGNTSALTCV